MTQVKPFLIKKCYYDKSVHGHQGQILFYENHQPIQSGGKKI